MPLPLESVSVPERCASGELFCACNEMENERTAREKRAARRRAVFILSSTPSRAGLKVVLRGKERTGCRLRRSPGFGGVPGRQPSRKGAVACEPFSKRPLPGRLQEPDILKRGPYRVARMRAASALQSRGGDGLLLSSTGSANEPSSRARSLRGMEAADQRRRVGVKEKDCRF